jgi:hypothetical protein
MKKKGAWFLLMEGGIIRGKNLCIIGPNASECE